MTSNKLPPLPEPSDDDLPVPIAYGMRRKGEISVIGVVPNKVHVKPATSETYLREFEEVALFTAEQLHAAREQAFHDGQCQALRQSQSLPAGAVAGLVDGIVEDAMEIHCPRGEWVTGPATLSMVIAEGITKALQADAREKGEAVIPDYVMAALDRMCAPLDPSWLPSATAWADSRSMKVIRDYILATQQAQASEKDNG